MASAFKTATTYLLLQYSVSCGHHLDHFDHPRHQPSQNHLLHKRESQMVKLQVVHLGTTPEGAPWGEMINIDRCDPRNHNPLRSSIIWGILRWKKIRTTDLGSPVPWMSPALPRQFTAATILITKSSIQVKTTTVSGPQNKKEIANWLTSGYKIPKKAKQRHPWAQFISAINGLRQGNEQTNKNLNWMQQVTAFCLCSILPILN